MINFYLKVVHDESLSKVIILHGLIFLLKILLWIYVHGIYTCLCDWVNINSM